MLTIGCHLSTHYGYERMAEEAVSINANTFQYFTRNPRGGHQRALDEKDIEAFNHYAQAHNIVDPLGYAPYDLDPGEADQAKQDFARLVMMEDLARLALMPGSRYLIRPGSAQDEDTSSALNRVAEALNHSFEAQPSIPILLVNMPGEGHQIGSTFEELAAIVKATDPKYPLGILLDTSAAYAAGYDLKTNLDGVLEQFDQTIGLDKLKAIHLNDIKESLGSDADRHARIGEGQLGFEALAALTVHPALRELPFYLEEPKADLVIYEKDIARFREYAEQH